ncbi:Hypothetical protein A7982_08810 [Minicystis rosea]|nr:Hypothetical protein A7982_08810 [Minicystis rosea]
MLAVILLCTTAAAAAIPRYAVEFLAPHTAKRSTAVLDKPLDRAVDTALGKAEIHSVEEAMDFALSASDKLLRFGLEHPTSMSFSASEREGNCIEYAHFFARVFDKAASKAGLSARAYAVHSEKARVFGKTMPLRGWDNHDWVLIQEGNGEDARRWFVDPTLHDMGLGWDISTNVHGPITVDAKIAPREDSGDKANRSLPQAAKKSTKTPH